MKRCFFVIYAHYSATFSALQIHQTAFSCHNNTSFDYAEAFYETVAQPHYSTRTGLYTSPMFRAEARQTVFRLYKICGAPFPEKQERKTPDALRKRHEELTGVYKHMYRSLMTNWD